MAFATSGLVVDLAANEATRRNQLGLTVQGTDGSLWEYVYAGSGIAQYQAVVVNGCGTAYPATTALAVCMKKIGVAQNAITCNYYGWVARQGYNLSANLVASATATSQLYTTSTAGALGSTLVTAAQIAGALSVTAASGGGTTVCGVSLGTPSVVIAAAPGS